VREKIKMRTFELSTESTEKGRLHKSFEEACRCGDLKRIREYVNNERFNGLICLDKDRGKEREWLSGFGLYEASLSNNLEAVKYLIQKGAIPNLAGAIAGNNLEIVKHLVEECNCDKEEYFYLACRNNELEIVKYLIEKGVNVNRIYPGYNVSFNIRMKEITAGAPLYYAAANGNLEIVRLLVEAGADVNAMNGKAMYIALKNGENRIIEYLAENGAEFNSSRDCAKEIEVFKANYLLKNIEKNKEINFIE
jgi:ankyrin repeat protein